MSHLAPHETEQIRAPLHRARARLRLLALIDAGLIGGVVGAAAFLLALFERRVVRIGFLPSEGWLSGHWLADLGAAGVLALAVTGMVAIWRLRHVPDAAALARLADRRFGLDERISTAIGLKDTGPAGAVLHRALLADAVTHLPRIIPDLLAPLRPAAIGLAFPVLAALGLAAALLLPEPPAIPAPARIAEAPEMDAADRRAAAADVTRVADIMREQAESRDDSYMEAVARTLDGLARQLESDPALTRAGAVAALEALGAEARAAGEGWRGQAGERLPDMVAALAEMLATPQPDTPSPAPGAIPDAMAAGLNGDPSAPGAPGQPQPANGPRDGLEAMMDSFAEASDRPSEATASGDGLTNPVVRGNYFDGIRPESEMAAQRASAAYDAAQLMGPSSNAQAGESILAGAGTDALDQGAAEPLAVTFETSGDFVLEAHVQGEGRQMLRDLPPEAVLSTVTAFDLADAQAGWQRLPTAGIRRTHIDPALRESVQSYFLTLAAEVTR